MLEAIVSRESENAGYYWVVPSVGGGAVEAVDIHRLGTFAAGEKVTIIQIGSEYGIAKKAAGLPGVVEVPKAARDAVALKNPAQFFCAYLATKLGKIKRFYELGTVIGAESARVIVETKGVLKRLSVAPNIESVATDFMPQDLVVIKKSDNGDQIAGWWIGEEFFDRLILGEVTDLLIMLKDKTGAQIEGGSPSKVWVEYGHYDLEGELTGIPGAFMPFYHRKVFYTQDRGGLTAYDSFAQAPLLPNKFRITYQYNDDWLTKTFNAEGFNTDYEGGFGVYDNWATVFGEDGSLTLFPSISNVTFDSADFVGYRYFQLSVKPGPYLLHVYGDGSIGRILSVSTYAALSVGADGSWSILGSNLYPDAAYGVAISAFGKLKKAKPRYGLLGNFSQFKSSCSGSITTSWGIDGGGGARAFNTVPLSPVAELLLAHPLEAKAYTPSVTTPPSWADEESASTVTVLGAGSAAANGLYTFFPDEGYYLGENPYYAIGYSGGAWLIVSLETSTVLYTNAGGTAEELPKTGWQVVDGDAPAPTVEY